jgi:hypothetical protein
MKKLLALLLVLDLGLAAVAPSASGHVIPLVRNYAGSTGTFLTKQSGQDNYGGLDDNPLIGIPAVTTTMVSFNFNSASCTNLQGWTEIASRRLLARR